MSQVEVLVENGIETVVEGSGIEVIVEVQTVTEIVEIGVQGPPGPPGDVAGIVDGGTFF